MEDYFKWLNEKLEEAIINILTEEGEEMSLPSLIKKVEKKKPKIMKSFIRDGVISLAGQGKIIIRYNAPKILIVSLIKE